MFEAYRLSTCSIFYNRLRWVIFFLVFLKIVETGSNLPKVFAQVKWQYLTKDNVTKIAGWIQSIIVIFLVVSEEKENAEGIHYSKEEILNKSFVFFHCLLYCYYWEDTCVLPNH